MKRWIYTAVVVTMVVAARPAVAGDKAQARALRDRANQLATRGQFAEACPLYGEVYRLDPSAINAVSLATCFEKIGRTASAWALYREVASDDSTSDPVSYAKQRVRRVAGQVPYLTIVVSDAPSTLSVTQRGTPVSPVGYGVPIAVDPGEIEVVATAEGHVRWSRTVTLAAGGSVTVEVPPLARAELPPAPAPRPPDPGVLTFEPPKPPRDSGATLRTAGYVSGAAGIVALGVGIGFGFAAKSAWNAAKSECSDGEPRRCTPAGIEHHDRASSRATIATVAVSAGLVAVAGGVTLVLVSRRGRPERTVSVAPGPGLVVAGSF